MKDAFSFGPFRLYPVTRILRKNGTVVSLGSRAFDVLVAMVQQNGKVLTRRELMAIAWPELIVEDSNVRVQVAKLRRALGCGRDGARYIANVAGRGYCFVAPVKRIESVDRVAPEAHVVRATEAPRSLSNFPLPLNGAIGREECVAELAQVVIERRLATVVGAAGAGKTTLAILVAHALDAFDDSIFFVDLSTVGRDDMIAEALASAVGYMPSGGDLLPGLLEVLSARRSSSTTASM
jgi:DNA-binding winged helix-turn-helix (wHTH) protein